MLKPFSLGRKLFRDISKNQGGLNYLDYDRFMGKVWKKSIFLTDMHWTALRETAFLSPSIAHSAQAWNENVLSYDDVFAKINNKQNVSNEFFIEVS